MYSDLTQTCMYRNFPQVLLAFVYTKKTSGAMIQSTLCIPPQNSFSASSLYIFCITFPRQKVIERTLYASVGAWVYFLNRTYLFLLTLQKFVPLSTFIKVNERQIIQIHFLNFDWGPLKTHKEVRQISNCLLLGIKFKDFACC